MTNSAGSSGGARTRRSQHWGSVLAALLCVLLSRHVLADEPGFHPFSLDVHGFVSQGFMLSSSNNYLTNSRRGSFELTEVGINFTKTITDDLSVGMQLFMRDLGPIGNYKPQFDWAYLDYHFRDWLGFRAGRTKLPFGLYNDQADIDAARVPVLLPQSVYPTNERDFLLAQTGFELYGYERLPALGALDYRVYGGTIFIDQTTLASPAATVNKIDVPYVVGGRLLWRAPTPLDGLTLGGSAQALRINIDYSLSAGALAALAQKYMLPANFNGRFKYELPAFLWVGSLEYAAHDILLAAEYSRWRLGRELRPEIVPDSDATQTRWYVMGSYRAASWMSPGAYYSVLNSGVAGPLTRDKYQQDFAVTTRFDINQNWLVKLEGHYMRGTAALDSTLNSNIALGELSRVWGVFMAKTTAYF
ncbi:MAG TPA: hypothetical protein VLJ38_07090 [Polyangiaceae bacterium]|nr:hypothetical protein [Polyangiaceae bacterium]